MQNEQKQKLLKYLDDARAAAVYIIVETEGLSVSNFERNNIKWLVERAIEIISEALKRASVIDADLPINNLHKIFATRNKIAHEYDLIDTNLLYTIVTKYLPILITDIKELIHQLEQ